MASTAYKDTGAFLIASGTTFHMDAYVNYDSATRSNNTVSINGANGVFKVTGPSGYYFSGYSVVGAYQFPTNTTRRTQDFGTGTRTVGDVIGGSENNFSISVDKNATSVSVRAGASYAGDSVTWTSSSSITIPALGAPSGLTASASAVTDTTATLSASLSSWGTNATAGTGQRLQYWIDGGAVNYLAYSTAASHSRAVTGLTANAKCFVNSYALNGGGKDASSTTATFYTLASATETSKDVQATSATFVAAVVQGVYATSTKVQYRQTGETTWLESAAETGATPTLVINGLTPSVDYEYRYAVTTTAGTWYSTVRSLSSLPAVQLIVPAGTVINAVPYTIQSNGTVTMVNVQQVA